MATVIRSRESLIQLALATAAATATGFAASQVFIGTRQPPAFNAQADRYAVITPGAIVASPVYAASNGRIAALVTERFGIVLRTRAGLDESDRAGTALTNPSLGHQDAWHALVDRLHIAFQPVDADGDWLLSEPARLGQRSDILPSKTDPTWLESTTDLECVYQLDLNQAQQ